MCVCSPLPCRLIIATSSSMWAASNISNSSSCGEGRKRQDYNAEKHLTTRADLVLMKFHILALSSSFGQKENKTIINHFLVLCAPTLVSPRCLTHYRWKTYIALVWNSSFSLFVCFLHDDDGGCSGAQCVVAVRSPIVLSDRRKVIEQQNSEVRTVEN